MHISTILFDIGSTLVYSKDPWSPIYEKADRALVDALYHAGIGINPESFYHELGGFIRSYYDILRTDNIEQTTYVALRDLLSQKGFPNVPEPVLRAALDGLYAITQKNWYLEDDAIQTLETLLSNGYRLGMISNTSDDRNVQKIVDRFGLRRFFEIIITSAALGIRKPDPRIFKVALDHFQIEPGAAAMVGDTLEADILGANQLGIYSIWITRRIQILGDDELLIQPKAVITALSQIPDLLIGIENDPLESLE
jgi:HAD superfamily hydrolase (TIGR01662 family)